MTPRPSWNEWAMSLAEATALRATCNRRQVGAVLLSANGRVLSTGYNGTVSGARHCNHTPEGSKCIDAVHAEANALMNLLRQGGGSSSGASCFITLSPCLDCAKLLIAAGVSRVVYKTPYRLLEGVQLLTAGGRLLTTPEGYFEVEMFSS